MLEIKSINHRFPRFELTDEKINMKVSKGTVSGELSLEPGKVTLISNRLIIDSTNFKLDGNGNATFSGTVEAATINSSTITGNKNYSGLRV